MRYSVKHSLHRRYSDAKTFHGCFAGFVALAAATVLIPGTPLGTITTLVQALAGILLPSTLVMLLLLYNDSGLLCPLTNPRWLNVLAGSAVAVIVVLTTLLTITTLDPRAPLSAAIALSCGLFLSGGLVLAASHANHGRPRERPLLTPWQRQTWTAPMLEMVGPVSSTRTRRLGLAMLRCYTALMVALLLAKLIATVA